MLNNIDANKNNRWVCTTPNEISDFKKIMLAVSAMALFTLFLLYFFSWIFQYLYTGLIVSIINSDSESASKMADMLITEELFMLVRNIASMCISIFSFTLSCLFFMFIINGRDKGVASYVSFKPKLPKNSIVLIIVGLSIVQLFAFMSGIFDYTLTLLFGIEKYANTFSTVPQTTTGIIVYFLSVVVTPSLLEEFAFRYLMLNSLLKYGNNFAIIVSSVLFGFIHASTSAFFFATALGMFSAYMAIRTKSLWFSIILHAAVNGASMSMEYVGNVLFETVFLNFIFAVSMISIIVYIMKDKRIELTEHKNHVHIKKTTKLKGFWNIITILFFLIVIVISTNDYVSI